MRLLALLALLSLPARADTIHLKNGNQMEGVVVSETASEVTVNIGYGTVVLQKADIEKISRASKEQRAKDQHKLRRAQFENGALPRKPSTLSSLMSTAAAARGKALEAKAKEASLEEERKTLEAELPELNERYAAQNDQMQGANPNKRGYNALIDDLNKTGTQIHADELRLRRIPVDKEAGQKAIHAYLQAFKDLDAHVKGPGKDQLESEGPDAEYYAWVKDELAAMRSEVAEDEIAPESDGRTLIVSALINGKVRVRLAVDTGATMVVLTKKAAERLALPADALLGDMRVTVADGNVVQAKQVRLDSVTVGKSTAKGIEAALMATDLPGIDGLLGMTFLGRFLVQVDAANGRLVLERLK